MRKIEFSIYQNEVEISKRDCHDFVTKIWSIDSNAEDLEMNETHIVIEASELEQDLTNYGLQPEINISFNPISDIMNYYGMKILDGDDWGRQLFNLSKIIK